MTRKMKSRRATLVGGAAMFGVGGNLPSSRNGLGAMNTGQSSMNQSPSKMSTSQSVSTNTKQSRYNFGKQKKTTQAIHKEVIDEEKLQELCLDVTKRVIDNHI